MRIKKKIKVERMLKIKNLISARIMNKILIKKMKLNLKITYKNQILFYKVQENQQNRIQ